MKILGIDTSSSALGIALTDEKILIGEFTQNKALAHSEKLMPLIEMMMNNLDEDIENLDAVVATIGPGSFTGIRIGVATANAFSMALNIPVIGISALRAMAYNFVDSDYVVFATMYAQRNDFYRGAYKIEEGIVTEILSEDAISMENIVLEIKECIDKGQKVILSGEILEKLDDKEEKEVLIKMGVIFAKKNNSLVRASNLCILAEKEMTTKIEYIQPVYIRKPQAEVQYEQRQKLLEKENLNG